MKIQLGKLRKIIREAAGEHDLTEYEGFEVGEWYTDSRGNVSQLIRLRTQQSQTGESYVMARTQTSHSYVDQRFEFWAEDKRLATPEEVADAQAAWEQNREWMAKNIDTSREGT